MLYISVDEIKYGTVGATFNVAFSVPIDELPRLRELHDKYMEFESVSADSNKSRYSADRGKERVMDRNRQRASNYAQTSVYPFKGRYADWEDELVLEHTIPDRTLSSMLQRSVVSIQMRRSRLKKILERNESFEAEEDEPQTEREGE